ncbi:hypothetical protein SAMN05216553_11157 [Lentzea fradiae]|uniref:Uncharacterized protein n=1 Tax=Lentzea fradiae TaxID=200378 RepID=A0A1G7WUA0_9PSEU|nr:hypothetical protein [Lentzea fradiae]SDG75545.1 hypothetical protein SAMN05216553_11157 [Lentzea fradiae]
MDVSERVAARVRGDFPAEQVDEVLREVARTETGNQDVERVQAAVVLAARGDLERLTRLVELSHVDWRDLLMAAGLGHGNWPELLDEELGPA